MYAIPRAGSVTPHQTFEKIIICQSNGATVQSLCQYENIVIVIVTVSLFY